jgi:molecular chaperone DnaK
LSEATSGLAQKMYEEQAAEQQAEGAASEQDGTKAGDDVMDAEFEEVKDDKENKDDK